MPYPQTRPRITIGVDTHADTHVAVALDSLGARLNQLQIPTTHTGYNQLEQWARSLGHIDSFGVEGTGSYGAELARVLHRAGHRVIEVNRPDRATRRRLGKNDPLDAETAARAVLAGVATSTPKTADGEAEMIRMLKIARDCAVKTRTATLNQIKAILVTAPAPLRQQLRGLATVALLKRCAGFRPGELSTPTAVARHTLRLLAQTNLALRTQIRALQADIKRLAARAAPNLLETFGVGPDAAATLLITAGTTPTDCTLQAAFAALCGANPIPASSGKTNRHRLNRGGNRQANATLHRITVVRLRWHEPTQNYMARRLAEGKTKTEIMRCLKRYIAREIYHALCPTPHHQQPPNDLPQTT
jgi:transposase